MMRNQEEVHFSDNTLLIDLCGEFDKHLVQIESYIGVSIQRRGNILFISGEKTALKESKEILKSLYTRLEDGLDVDAPTITAAIKMYDEEESAQDYDKSKASSHDIEIHTRKKRIEPRTKTQKKYVVELLKRELIFGLGPAGTGKTYLAVAAGVSMFLEGYVDKIILARPAVEAGERLGFLPGDMKEKVDPYMQPLYDALNDFLPFKQVAKLIEEKKIEIAPLAFMRGRTLSNAFILLDEAQNTTSMQMKMFLTRMGEGSRMVITGDGSQIDLPRGVSSGLLEAQQILKNIAGIEFIHFTADDVVRHPMVAKIIKAYDTLQ